MWQSVSKSLVSCVAANLVAAGVAGRAGARRVYVPELAGSAYGDALVRHLLDMQVGIDYSEDYEDPDSDVERAGPALRGSGRRAPPGTLGRATSTRRRTRKRGPHGEGFEYVSLNVNVLAWVLERATGVWLPDLVRTEVWDKLGGEHDAYIALDVAGSAQAESGMCSSLRDLARFGLALSRQASWANARSSRRPGSSRSCAAATERRSQAMRRPACSRVVLQVQLLGGPVRRGGRVHGQRHLRPDGLREPPGGAGRRQVLDPARSRQYGLLPTGVPAV